MNDPVDHPRHYTEHPSGVEAITVCEHMSFNVGNAIKYLWRADLKGNAIEDLRKAAWYVSRELERRSRITEIQQSKNNEKPEENAIAAKCYCKKSSNKKCDHCRGRAPSWLLEERARIARVAGVIERRIAESAAE